MIRVNLLPGRKTKRAGEGSQRQLVFMGAGVVLGVVGIVAVHMQKSSELEELQRANNIVQSDIDRLKAEMGDYDKIKAQREELLKQRRTIQALEASRTGPVFVLREVSEILSPGKGPTFDAVDYQNQLMRDPNAGWNPSWEPRRVWLDSFDETGKRVAIRGAAKSNEDVAEFLKRLNLSVFFKDVTPESTSQVASGGAGSSIKYVNFNLSASVVY